MFKSLMSTAALTLALASSTLAAEIKIVQNEALNTLSSASQERLISAAKALITRWINAFNSGNAKLTTAQYEENTVTTATPFATFNGHGEIQPFW